MENEVLSIAINAVRGLSSGEFSKGEKSEAIRKALIEMNGGSTKLSPKTFVRGTQLFALVEELIPVIVEEGIKDDALIQKLVEYKNIAEGDVNEFYLEDNSYFMVAQTAKGIRDVRRQRISGGKKVTVDTSMKTVRVYENLGRLLSGRISFDEFVAKVADAFKKEINADAHIALNSISKETAGLSEEYVVSGSYDEAKLLALIDHVEAATGKTAKIYGTRTALRKVTTATVAHEAETDMYNLGYYGKFNGTDMIRLAQVHKPGTNAFMMDDSKVYVIAGDDAPIKMVNEGEGIMLERQATENADLTQEYVYGQAWGTAVACSEKLGIYTFA